MLLRTLDRVNGSDRMTTIGPEKRRSYSLKRQVYYVPDQPGSGELRSNRVISPVKTIILAKKLSEDRPRNGGFVRMMRHAIGLSLVLILGSVRGWPQESRGEPTVTLKIEVSLRDGAFFYVPALGNGQMPSIVPLPNGRFAGIRITPRMRTDSVQIDVSALIATNKKLSEATCDEILAWKSEDAGSYEGKANATLLLSGLARLDAPVFKVKVIRAGGPPPGALRWPAASSIAFERTASRSSAPLVRRPRLRHPKPSRSSSCSTPASRPRAR
jgi:hypothetical protein